MTPEDVKEFLLEKAEQYEVPDFIPHDPLSIPHRFSRREDKEVSAFFAASLAWGNRVSIEKPGLADAMDHAPGQFVLERRPTWRFEGFPPNLPRGRRQGFVQALAGLLRTHGTLEQAMLKGWCPQDPPR